MDKKYLFVISIIAVVILGYIVFVMSEQYIHPNQCPVCLGTENRTFGLGMENRTFERENNFWPIPPQAPLSFFIIMIFLLLLPLIILYSNIQTEKKLSASAELLSKLMDKHNENKRQPKPSMGRELVARLLEPKEMAVVERLIEQPKGIPQSEIVKMPGMTKLKAHRVVERLRNKGIVTVDKIGKTNQIKLDSRTRSIISGLE